MSKFNWQSLELEWVEKVRQLLIELAGSCLGERPKLPDNLSGKTLPLVEQGQEILDAARDRGITEKERSQTPDLEWVAQVRELFLELARTALSERPRIPENLSQRSLALAEEAQSIQDAAEAAIAEQSRREATSPTLSGEAASEATELLSGIPPSPGLLLERLQKSIKIQWANSSHPDAPEWLQLINLLEIANSLYLRVKE